MTDTTGLFKFKSGKINQLTKVLRLRNDKDYRKHIMESNPKLYREAVKFWQSLPGKETIREARA